MPTIEHSLPGSGPNHEWFLRLNPFEQRETRRQVAFKLAHWPGSPSGAWSKDPDRRYPHILPEGDIRNALYSPIADELLEHCKLRNIAIHSEAPNLRSSQVCCFNVMFPLCLDLQLAKRTLSSVLPGVDDVTRIEFEYTGPAEVTEWLGEPPTGGRGRLRTSIDVAIWWRVGAHRYLTLCEWKYTERSYGVCGGYVSSRNRNRAACNCLLGDANPSSRCYLTLGEHHRLYWERLEEAGIDLGVFTPYVACPFEGPFYQLMRQFLLAAYFRKDKSLDQVFVVSLGFRQNTALHAVPARYGALGQTIEDAWSRCLTGVPRLRCANVEDIVVAARAVGAQTDWTRYLAERYGL